MSETKAGKSFVARVSDARTPVKMTTSQKGETIIERSRSPVPITPAQSQNKVPQAPAAPKAVPVKKG